MEACGPSGWINDLAMSHGLKTLVCSTNEDAWKWSNVKRINKMKCTIRAWFVNHGITIDAGDKAWHTGRDRINAFRKPLVECQPNELWKGELDIELTQMDALAEHMAIVVKKPKRSARATHALSVCEPSLA